MFASQFTPLDHWLADVYLLSTLLLVAGIGVMHQLAQPARRMAVARAVVAGAAILIVLAALPGRPRIGTVRWLAAGPATLSGSVVPSTPFESSAVTLIEVDTIVPAPAPIAVRPAAVRAAPLPPAPATPVFSGRLRSWRTVLGSAFALGAALNLAWLALGAVQAARLRRSARAADARVQRLMVRVAGDRRQQTRVLVGDATGLPFAIGVFRPAIVLPVDFVATEPDGRLEAALAHEWAHVRNGDLRWLALLRLLNIVLFAQPLFWWLRRTIRADQEALADAAAAGLHDDGRLTYAETLLDWARSSHRQQPDALASAALALWERPSLLHRRVRLLLDHDYRVEAVSSRRWKLAAACTGMLAAFLLSLVTLRPSAVSAREMKAPQAAASLSRANSGKAAAGGDRFEYAGRVLDPDGKPIAGAKLHLAYFEYQGRTLPATRAKSDAEGRFRIELRKEDFVDTAYETPWTTVRVVATAAGFGLGWADAFERGDATADPHNLTVRLARDDVPISGRLVDLEGRPVSGATIRPQGILEPEQGDLAAWIAASMAGSAGSTEILREYLKRKLWTRGSGLPVSITTDAEGRFAIRGAGRERLIQLQVSGPTIQTEEIGILTRDINAFQVSHARGRPDLGCALYYGNSFTHAAAPTKPVIGVVRDKDTGKSLAGVRIAADETAPGVGAWGIETITDEHGRYRLTGLPKGRGNHVIAIPARGQPYLSAGMDVPDTPGLVSVSIDFGLKRGVVIEGRVIDKTTGEPVKAFVEYSAYRDNPHLANTPLIKSSEVWRRYETGLDGSYRIIGLPGHGLIAARYAGGDKQYLKGVGLPKMTSLGDVLPVVPNGMLGHFHALSEVNPTNDATAFHRDLALDPGITRTVRIVGPQGRPLLGARITLQPGSADVVRRQQAAEFPVEGLRPGETRPVVAFCEEWKLAGWANVHAEQEGITELKLLPWGTLIGRLVDEDGGARSKVDMVYDQRHDYPAATDNLGRFRIEALVPGKPAKVWVSPMGGFLSGTIARALVLKPGEIKDLGDVREDKQ